MKPVLVSWCGITDMKAALGFEQSCAIMGALQNDEYSALYILQYTDENKMQPENIKTVVDIEQIACGMRATPEKQEPFLNALSNTAVLNEYCTQAFLRYTQAKNVGTKIHSRNIPLARLNDVENIYAAVIQVLDSIVAEHADCSITLNISSGTPTMAFVWAFASLRYPRENISLMSSSQVGCTPEIVELPEVWKRWHARRICTSPPENAGWDVVYHLFGEQPMPALVGVSKLPARKHVFIYSRQYPAECMRSYVEKTAAYDGIEIDAYDWLDILSKVKAHVNTLPHGSTIAFNLTGGTKIMYACVLEFSKELHAQAYYFDFRNRRMIELQSMNSYALDYSFSLPTIINVHSTVPLVDCCASGIWQQDQYRTNLIMHIYTHFAELKEWDHYVRRLYPTPKLVNQFMQQTSFSELKTDKVSVSLAAGGMCNIQWAGKTFQLNNYPGIIKFLLGGWFEEMFYVKCVLPLTREGLIRESRLSMELVSASDPGSIYQELDSVFTDGKRLYVVECKSGKVLGEHVTKLSDIVRSYGGMGGRGVLCHIEDITSRVIRAKAKERGILLLRIPKCVSSGNIKPELNAAVGQLRTFIKKQ